MKFFDVDVTLKGQTNLLIHTIQSVDLNRVRSRTETFEDEWKRTVYLSNNRDGTLIMPALNIEACIRMAAKGHKIGRSAARTFVASAVQITEDEIPLTVDGSTITLDDVENHKWLFTTTAVIQRARINRTRVSLPVGWTLDFKVMCTSDVVSPDFLKLLLEEAGSKCGLGDWRPSAPSPGRFGKFELETYKVH